MHFIECDFKGEKKVKCIPITQAKPCPYWVGRLTEIYQVILLNRRGSPILAGAGWLAVPHWIQTQVEVAAA